MDYRIEVYKVGEDEKPIKIVYCEDKTYWQVEKVESGMNINMSPDYYTLIVESPRGNKK